VPSYTFKWKKHSIFWNKRQVKAHRFDEKQNKMILYYENGSIEEIANWKDCSLRLGLDWVETVTNTTNKKLAVKS